MGSKDKCPYLKASYNKKVKNTALSCIYILNGLIPDTSPKFLWAKIVNPRVNNFQIRCNWSYSNQIFLCQDQLFDSFLDLNSVPNEHFSTVQICDFQFFNYVSFYDLNKLVDKNFKLKINFMMISVYSER